MRSWISRINDFWSKCGSRSKKAVREAESVLSDGFFCCQSFLPCFVFLTLFPCLVFLALSLLPCFLALFFLPCLFCPVSLALFLSCAKIFAKKKGNLML